MTEFDDVIRLLKDERPQATELELDEIKQRVRRRAADPSRRSSQSMKSRIAILGMLVAGMVFSTAGAGLAISGGQAKPGTNAAISQYATPTPTPTPVCTPDATRNNGGGGTPGGDVTPTQCGEGGVLPAESERTPTPTTENAPATGNAPTTESGGGVLPAEDSESDTQPVRQQAAAAQTSQLPFTGFAAIPVLLGGLALLTGGLVLRRRTRS